MIPRRGLGEHLQEIKHVAGLGADGVVGIDGGVTDEAFVVNEVAGGHGELPGVHSVGLGDIESELEVEIRQFLGEAVGKTECV